MELENPPALLHLPEPEYPRARGLTASYYIDRNIRERENVHSMAKGIRVLYVDDEPGLLEIAGSSWSRPVSFLSRQRTSAEEALASPGLPLQDVIVSDYQMPGMDGIVFLKEVRQRHWRPPLHPFYRPGPRRGRDRCDQQRSGLLPPERRRPDSTVRGTLAQDPAGRPAAGGGAGPAADLQEHDQCIRRV